VQSFLTAAYSRAVFSYRWRLP